MEEETKELDKIVRQLSDANDRREEAVDNLNRVMNSPYNEKMLNLVKAISDLEEELKKNNGLVLKYETNSLKIIGTMNKEIMELKLQLQVYFKNA